MLARAVVIPWSPLLVPGAAGAAQVLGGARELVLRALARLLDDAVPGDSVAVLAPGPLTRSGRLRPSLAAAGVADRWVPVLRAWDVGPGHGHGPEHGPEHGHGHVPAHLPASVALCCLADVWGPGRTDVLGPLGDVTVHEVSPVQVAPDSVVAQVRAAARLVVVAPELATDDAAAGALGVSGVLADLASGAGWREREVREVAEHGPHLGATYQVTTLGLPPPG